MLQREADNLCERGLLRGVDIQQAAPDLLPGGGRVQAVRHSKRGLLLRRGLRQGHPQVHFRREGRGKHRKFVKFSTTCMNI